MDSAEKGVVASHAETALNTYMDKLMATAESRMPKVPKGYLERTLRDDYAYAVEHQKEARKAVDDAMADLADADDEVADAERALRDHGVEP